MTRAALFLLEAVFGFFTILFLLRFFMQILRVSFLGPFGQFVVKLTHWAVRPLRRIIPSWRSLDLASLLPAYLLQLALAFLIYLLPPRLMFTDDAHLALFMAWLALLGLFRQTLHLFFFALLLQALLSWINPHSPLAGPLHQFTRPFLDPIRRVLPPIAGIDLSPLVLIVLIQALLMLL
ncbi:MAG: YGGT family protein [Betaproteobacteria bacterium ADurb.Bin341]|nr:MAG: YGGT family protein [Betaproteobacteria bacterium ADurb.Bin341]